ncbi:MAG: DNA-binding transcriptional LysR family regulator [Halioglobus sp.]
MLTRSPKGVGLTPAGEKLKPHAEDILGTLARALQEAPHAPPRPQQLSIGGTPNLWDFVLQGYLRRIRESHPGISLRAECHDSGYLISQLQSRQLDFAILFEPLRLEDLVCESIANINFVLASTETDTTFGKFDESNYVFIDWSVGFGIEHDQLLGRSLQPSLIASTGSIALDFLLQQGGTAFFPEHVLETYSKTNLLQTVSKSPSITLPVFLSYREGSTKRPLIKTVSELLHSDSADMSCVLRP